MKTFKIITNHSMIITIGDPDNFKPSSEFMKLVDNPCDELLDFMFVYNQADLINAKNIPIAKYLEFLPKMDPKFRDRFVQAYKDVLKDLLIP